MNKPLVYIASPYTLGDPAINTRYQCELFDAMMDDGLVLPYAPLWSHFQHTMFPRPYADWLVYDLEFMAKVDACLRMTATFDSHQLHYSQDESAGADREVERCAELGVPVFESVTGLYEWVHNEWEDNE